MKRGFTLLELLLVLALIGLITGVIMPRLGGSLSGIKTRSATNKVAAMFRYARNRAVAEQVPFMVAVDRPGRRVVFAAAGEGETGPGREPKVYNLPEGVEIAEVRTFADKDGQNGIVQFVFSVRGSCDGGEVVLAGKKQSYRIQLDRITGIVEVD